MGTTAAERESAILAAAAALLEEGASYAALSVEEIAGRAGLGRTNFYFYFSDKQALLSRLAEGAAEELYDQADAWWRCDGDGAEALERNIEPVVDIWMRHRAVLAAVVQAAALDDEIRAFWRGTVTRFVDTTRERIEHEQAAGRALGVSPHDTAFALVWMTERVCYEHEQQHGDSSREWLIRALTGIWLRSVYGAR